MSARQPGPPPAATVAHNAWTRFERPKLGTWTPSRTVSVVIPAFECQEELDLTLTALARQTYPASLTQVIVVDDGSEPPLRPRVPLGDLEVSFLRQANTGFGSGRARNAGAAAAEGEILMLQDADMIAAPWQLEAHARWHHLARDVVTLGERRHVDVDGLTPEALAAAAGRGTTRAMDELFAGREQWGVPWIERFVERTKRLTAVRPDLFRIFTGGNAAMSRELWEEAGGMTVFGVRGIEDTELGYRLFNAGAVFVPERQALNWHQGVSFFQGEAKARAKHDRTPLLANHIPVGGFRSKTGGRAYAVPALAVFVPVGDAPAAGVVELVDAILAGDFLDVAVRLLAGDEYPEVKYLRDAFEGDARVEVLEGSTEPPYALAGRSPAFALLPPVARPGPGSLRGIFDRLTRSPVAGLHLTIPGISPRAALVHAYATGASRRGARIAADVGGTWEEAVGRIFGEAWVPGGELELRAFDADLEGRSAEGAVQAVSRPE